MAKLTYTAGGSVHERRLGPSSSVGRLTDNLVALAHDPSVSKRHCVIELRGGGFVLRDLESRNGVSLRGHRIHASVMLRDGDEIQVGDTVLRYLDPERAPDDRLPPDAAPGAVLAARASDAQRLEEFEQCARVGAAAHQALVEAFASEALAPPPVPASLAPRLRALGRFLFATHPQRCAPYHEASFVLTPPPHEDYLVVGHGGHGVNSYAWFYGLRLGPLDLTLEIPWGGAYDDPAVWRRCCAEAYPLVDEIVRALFAARAEGRLRLDARVGVFASFMCAESQWRVRSPDDAHQALEQPASGSGPAIAVLTGALTWLRTRPSARREGAEPPPAGPAVVFLDIDRVCNHAASRRRLWAERIEVEPEKLKRAMISTLVPELVARVQRVCDEAGAAVVIVSGWRRRMSAAELTEALRGVGLGAPVLGFIPEVPSAAAPAGGDARAAGARAWLDAHPEVTRWVVIDDGRDHWRPTGTGDDEPAAWFEGRTIHPEDGVLDEHVAAAVAALQAPAR